MGTPNRPAGQRPRAVFVVSVDWFFLSHRLPLARQLRDRGWDIHVAATDTGRLEEVRAEGMEPVALPWNRWGTNPADLLRGARFLTALYRDLRPDLVHHVAPKPVVLGSLAARRTPGVAVVNAITGFGHSGGSGDQPLAGLPMRLAMRSALRHPRAVTIFQNRDDLEAAVTRLGAPRERTRLIRGSGVDPTEFSPAPEPPGPPVVVLASRMLRAKGIEEFVEAARLVKNRHPDVRFALVGEPDAGNPDAIDASQLDTWARSGSVEWWGHRSDMAEVHREAAVVVLPTAYGEGLPKVLLEAAACGRPIVASTVPGCREIVHHGVNGLLVAPRDARETAAAVEQLLDAPHLRHRMGAAGRELVLSSLTLDEVCSRTLSVYTEALRHAGNRDTTRHLTLTELGFLTVV